MIDVTRAATWKRRVIHFTITAGCARNGKITTFLYDQMNRLVEQRSAASLKGLRI